MNAPFFPHFQLIWFIGKWELLYLPGSKIDGFDVFPTRHGTSIARFEIKWQKSDMTELVHSRSGSELNYP